jgi:hypothetical protein
VGQGLKIFFRGQLALPAAYGSGGEARPNSPDRLWSVEDIAALLD